MLVEEVAAVLQGAFQSSEGVHRQVWEAWEAVVAAALQGMVVEMEQNED